MKDSQTTVILFRGRPGVGKTTITNAFSEKIKSVVLRKDDIYDVTSKYIDDNTSRNKLSYSVLYKVLESNKNSQTSIILDYPFQINENVIELQKWCKENSIKLLLVLVTCSDKELWKQRFNKRAENPTPNQLITDLDELEKHYGTLDIEPLEGELVIDTIIPMSEIIKNVLVHTS